MAPIIATIISTTLISFMLYANLPSYQFEVTLPSIGESSSITILFPGAGGPDANTDRIIDSIKTSSRDGDSISIIYDWGKWSKNLVRASFNGEHIGSKLGKQLGMLDNIENIHIIGVSVGSFCANSCAKEFLRIQQIKDKTKTKNMPMCRLTFLDPFTARGLFQIKYGLKLFGKYVKYCESYLNTDDPVPFTNEPLVNSINFDVTKSSQRNSFDVLPMDNMHSWPAGYYGLNWRRIKRSYPSKFFECRPKGTIIKIYN
eukprot:gene13332-17875_t